MTFVSMPLLFSKKFFFKVSIFSFLKTRINSPKNKSTHDLGLVQVRKGGPFQFLIKYNCSSSFVWSSKWVLFEGLVFKILQQMDFYEMWAGLLNYFTFYSPIWTLSFLNCLYIYFFFVVGGGGKRLKVKRKSFRDNDKTKT